MTWKDLPVETLHLILDQIPFRSLRKTIVQCALVCKDWRLAAQYRLYLNVNIDTIPNLIRFNRTITEGNSTVADIIQKVDLEVDSRTNESENLVYTLLTNLPNLQHFCSPKIPCFVQITDAFLEGKLTNLKTIAGPEFCIFPNDYITCALLLKDRLQNISLDYRSIPFNRLKDRLHLFKKLAKLSIKKTTTDFIEEVESIMKRHPNLKELEANIETRVDFEDSKAPVKVEDIPFLYSPKANFNTLYLHFLNLSNPSLSVPLKPIYIEYIMHKFPELQSLTLFADWVITDQLLLDRFIEYLSKIKKLELSRITSDPESILRSIGKFWKAKKIGNPRRLENVFIYLNREAYLRVANGALGAIGRITMIYGLLSTLGIKTIENYGEYIGMLLLNGFRKQGLRDLETEAVGTILEKLFTTISTCAINLKKLSIVCSDVNLGKPIPATVDIPKGRNIKIQNVEYQSCDIGTNDLHVMLGGVQYIEHLQFSDCMFRDVDNKRTSLIQIQFPNTKFKYVSIIDSKNPHRGTRYLLLLISRVVEGTFQRQNLFYICDLQTSEVFRQIDEEEYHQPKYHTNTHIHFDCQTFQSLNVVHEGRNIFLASN